MKLSILLPSPSNGGAERAMIKLANGLARANYAVDLLVLNPQGEFSGEIDDVVNIVVLRPNRLLTSLPALVAYLVRRRPKFLLSGLNHTHVACWLATKVLPFRVQVVLSAHNQFSMSFGSGSGIRGKVLEILTKLAFRDADGITAVSSGVKEDLVETIGVDHGRIEVIFNPIVDDSIRDLAKQKLVEPWLQAGQPPVVLAIGRLVEQKAFDVLLEAFARVRRQKFCRLIILGDGPLRGELHDQADQLSISEAVLFPGFVENPFQYLAKSSVFVLSSSWEGLPTVLVEALACGTKIVSTNCRSGPAEILADGKYGILVPVGNPILLGSAILESLESDHNLSSQQRRAQLYSVNHAIARFSELLTLLEKNESNNGGEDS